MKKQIYLTTLKNSFFNKVKAFALVLVCFNFSQSKANILTVDNSGSNAQYATLQSAFVAAGTNDTLMVSGSSLQYAITSASWNKSLVVIGTGFNSEKQVFKEVKFGPGTFFLSDSSKFIGIRFTNNINFTASVAKLSFESCRFDGDVFPGSYNLSNVSFFNCVFPSNNSNFLVNNSNANSIFFSHCVFSGYFTGSNNTFNYAVTADHCVFLHNNSCFSNVFNMVITNSIFYGTNPISDIYNSSFSNNRSRVSVSANWAINGNISSNNIDADDPLFVNVPVNSVYTTLMDFHLQNGSSAINAATNGSDIGLHDSSSTFDEAGEAQNIPVIRRMQIQNNNVPSNGAVDVTIRSTKAR